MGDLVRFSKPKDLKWRNACAQAVADELERVVSDDNGDAYLGDVSIVLLQAIYKVFYRMQDKNVKPEAIYEEMDWLLETLRDNFPVVKQNIWNWTHEEVEPDVLS